MGRFKDLLEKQETIILHGALGTELEARGYDISGNLWSAKFLLEDPSVIQKIHEDYVLAGADIITTSTYQASYVSLEATGLSQKEAKTIIIKSVDLAKSARDKAWSELSEDEKAGRILPLISGDVGPYAAYLSDGSEYTGDYGQVSKEDLKDFHRSRIALFVAEGVDLLALETMPNFLEIQALTELLVEEFPTVEAYLSITSQDGQHLSDGSDLKAVVSLVEQSQQILTLGINCSSPQVVEDVLATFSKLTDKHLVAYPNSGEVYDGKTQTWSHGDKVQASLAQCHKDWQLQFPQLSLLGGCCRTRPADIADIKNHIGTVSY
ncbi:homocysteine S-methyltransferase [Streptococcus hyovaginalis]|uniref:homocysteine S-methyltransferase n=1 Tax=Streptococcus hyovaginalis TaxID=149015 RepID=UPI003AE9EB06